MRFFILLFLCLTAGHAGFSQLKRKVKPAQTEGKAHTVYKERVVEKPVYREPEKPAEPRAKVTLRWKGSNTVLIKIDGEEFALAPDGETEANLKTGKVLKLEIQTPSKIFYPEDFLLVDPSGGLVEINLNGEKVVFSYESGRIRREREAAERVEAEREVAEQKKAAAERAAEITKFFSQLYVEPFQANGPITLRKTTLKSTISNSASAPLKIGYTNVDKILSNSPVSKLIQKQLEEFSQQYLKTIEEKNKELDSKFQAYENEKGNLSESVKKAKEQEIRDLQKSIQSLQENAQVDVQKKETDLLKPELDKIHRAINEFATTNSFSQIFNSNQMVLFSNGYADLTKSLMFQLGIDGGVKYSNSYSAIEKIGFTNVNNILGINPATHLIQKQLEVYQQQLLKTIEDKNNEFERKSQAYQNEQSNLSESIKKIKEDELRDLLWNIQSLQESSSEDLQKKETDLLKPELEKIYSAVNKIASSNGFTLILNSDEDLLYANENTDITAAILFTLGLGGTGSTLADIKPAKIGYTNVDFILSNTPGYGIIQKKLDLLIKQYSKELSDKNNQLEMKLQVFQKEQSKLSESLKSEKQEELSELQRNIQTLAESIKEDLQKKYQELLKPESDKILKAIKETAIANGFSHIVNSEKTLLYSNENSDVTSMVLSNLGVPD